MALAASISFILFLESILASGRSGDDGGKYCSVVVGAPELSLLANTNFLAQARAGEDGGDDCSLDDATPGAANPSMVLLNTSFLAFAVRTGVDGGT